MNERKMYFGFVCQYNRDLESIAKVFSRILLEISDDWYYNRQSAKTHMKGSAKSLMQTLLLIAFALFAGLLMTRFLTGFICQMLQPTWSQVCS